MNELFCIYDGRLVLQERAVLPAGLSGIMYGDGVFETMRMHNGQLLNAELHIQRLRSACAALSYHIPGNLIGDLTDYCRQLADNFPGNSHFRIRLTVFRRENVFAEQAATHVHYVIHCVPAAYPEFMAESSSSLLTYVDSYKGIGKLANIKSISYQLYLEAFRFATSQGAEEAILLNTFNRVCETSRANIYIIKNGKISTPSLAEGPVAGTIRQLLLTHADQLPLPLVEAPCTPEDLRYADEIFLTNAVRWVIPVTTVDGRDLQINYAKVIFEKIKSLLG